MLCSMCDAETKVIDSRSEVDCVKRRRECKECSFRFSTIEVDVDYVKSMNKTKNKDCR